MSNGSAPNKIGKSSRRLDSVPTVGVEEELLLVDPGSGHPVPKGADVVRVAKAAGFEFSMELTQCQVETVSPVCSTAAQLRNSLVEHRRGAATAASSVGATVLAVAVPPVVPHEFPITDTPRYRKIGERFGAIAHEQGICGAHVHVEVPDRETGVAVSNHLRPWLPMLLALTANSAIYRGVDTGHASWRSVLWSRWPSAGPPPYFESASHYDRIVAMMCESGVMVDVGQVYWDVRLSENFPTVEIRCSDVPSTVDETVLHATLVRAAVMTALAEIEKGDVAKQLAPEIVRAAYWKAAHDGLSGDGIDMATGDTVSAIVLLRRLVERIRPALEKLGEYEQVVTALRDVHAHGNGATTQIRTLRRRNKIADVLAEVARRTVS
ncbi:glutamate--cysteine ligase [Antrihabitans spumae]|jgi:glutamate---cysteine ligase / carboxylate-amine ligase|uniref:Putative glutamate--cysteine ligase 2 n=1 Tax=Antrihabitans spumae TaxID=3373370 RepID=A0ABW7JHQ5_9NOCA